MQYPAKNSINRRQFLAVSAAGGVVLASSNRLPAASVKQKKKKSAEPSPNILWICTDQQRFDTIACLGNPLVRTPNMDKLVEQGVTFTNAFAQSTVCTPSRAAFMTGRYPHLTGARGNGYNIRENEMLISKLFADNGYHCGLIGKLHLSASEKRVEQRIDDGYAEFIWSHDPKHEFGNQYHDWLESKGHKWDEICKKPKGGKEYYTGVPVHLHQSTWCFEKAIDFISRNKAKPWFLNINVFAPHHPFDPSPKFLEKYDPDKMPDPLYKEGELDNKPPNQLMEHNGAYGFKDWVAFSKMTPSQRREITAAYYAMIEQTDEQIGLLLEKLEDSGQKDNTIIVFHSDHGEMLGNHGIYLKGSYPYDDLIHVPLIIVWPGRFKAGLKSDALVELIDIAPTLLNAANQPVYAGMQGRSLLEICSGNADPHTHRDYVFAERYELSLNDKVPVYFSMIRDYRYKISVYHGLDIGELYDLQEDPHEFNNLWNDPNYTELKNGLIKKCFDAIIEKIDPLPSRTAVF